MKPWQYGHVQKKTISGRLDDAYTNEFGEKFYTVNFVKFTGDNELKHHSNLNIHTTMCS